MLQPLAYIHPDAKIAENVTIDPFTTIYGDVEIGKGTWIGPPVTIMDGARIGENCRFFLCGDYNQNDLNNKKEKSGFQDAMRILQRVGDVSQINFTIEDIVRSGFVKKYLMEKEKLGL